MREKDVLVECSYLNTLNKYVFNWVLEQPPNLPVEASLELGPMNQRVIEMAKPPPLWKTGQDGILYASNRAKNLPSYIPRFQKLAIKGWSHQSFFLQSQKY